MCTAISSDDMSAAARTSGGSFQIRAIIVGTRYRYLGRCSVTASSTSSGTNRGKLITWLPDTSASDEIENGALWYSTPGITHAERAGSWNWAASVSNTPGLVARMIFGRPVLPPEVGAFQCVVIASGSSASLIERSGS